ncbi:MAG: TonB-dependent receptor, partial [Pseudomonadota bacterium]
TGNNQLFRFNPDSTIYNSVGDNLSTFGKPIGESLPYGEYVRTNTYDSSRCNATNITSCATGPTAVDGLKYVDNLGYVNAPQQRFSFMGTGKYDITDNLSVSSSARFAQSKTRSYLQYSSGSGGYAADIPYNAKLDSPVVPQGTIVGGTAVDYTNAATVAAILANPSAYANPNFIGTGLAGAQHPVPLQMAILLNSRPANTLYCLKGAVGCASTNATADKNLVGTARLGRDSPWQAETYLANSYVGRNAVNTNTSWQVDAGLNYKLPLGDWTSELYYSHGEASSYTASGGQRSLARFRGIVTSPDYGRGAVLQSNLNFNPSLTAPGFASLPAPCTTGLYDLLFKGDAKPSDDCIYAMDAPLQARSDNQQDIVELNFEGGLFNLPAGEVRSAMGYQFRRNAAQFHPDILQTTASFTDQVIGLYPTGYLDAEIKANDVYAEFLIPVIADAPFLKKVELEIGGRYSDYSVTDSTFTYKVNANIQVNDFLRFRGGYNRATRAPNLGELYLPLQQLVGGTGTFGDPCGLLSNAPYGAGGATGPVLPNPAQAGTTAKLAGGQTAAGATSTYLICQAQMTPVGAGNFYGPTTIQAGGGAAPGRFANQIGNPNLDSEVADTWTGGVVLRSPFEHPLLNRFTATFDYYQIGINGAILPFSGDYGRFLCYGQVLVADAAAAAIQAQTDDCQAVRRDPINGTAETTIVSYDNQARVRTAGVDFTIDWRADLTDMGLGSLPGSIGINMQGTVLDYYRTKESDESYVTDIDWKGSLGPNLPSFNAGAYSYRLLTSLSYSLPAFSMSLRWRHLPSVVSAADKQQDSIIKNNAKVAAGGAGQISTYTPSVALPIKAYDVFDLSGSWRMTDTLSLRFGVDNVFDTDPASSRRTTGREYDYSLTPAQNAAAITALCAGLENQGCVVPTTYSFADSGRGTTAGGYYDSLGRRYYVGIKAQF